MEVVENLQLYQIKIRGLGSRSSLIKKLGGFFFRYDTDKSICSHKTHRSEPGSCSCSCFLFRLTIIECLPQCIYSLDICAYVGAPVVKVRCACQSVVADGILCGGFEALLAS